MQDKKSIGRYKLKSKLGQGAAGVVYKVFDPVLQRNVAIKVPRLDGDAASNNTARDFINEAIMGGQFHHENIVTIYDVGRDNQLDYLVMEYVDGVSLKKHLKNNKPLAIEYVTESIFRLCLALDYIHFNEIIHRDIKPDNVMVNDENDVLKLMDFSSASRIADTGTNKAGSAPYMAPEIHDADTAVGVESDIFSLGALMYEMLSGEMAFAAEDALACVYKVVNEQPVPLQKLRHGVPDELVKIVERALQKKPDRRFRSVLEFADALKVYRQSVAPVSGNDVLEEEKYLLFRKDEFFKNFSPDQVKEFMDAGEVKLYAANQTILTEGTENNTFYLILQGAVRVYKGQQLISKLSEGECFGEMSYLTESKTTASITAAEDVMIWGVTPGLLKKLSCSSQLGFQKAFIEMIVQRLTRGTTDIARLQSLLYYARQTKK